MDSNNNIKMIESNCKIVKKKKNKSKSKISKGKHLRNSVELNNTNNFKFSIQSESNENEKYEIYFKENKLVCSCGLKYIGIERMSCKHISAVLQKLIYDFNESSGNKIQNLDHFLKMLNF